jgi:transposase
MIRSGTLHTIQEVSARGKSLRESARIGGIARTTVRRYLRGKAIAVPRPKRGSIRDPYQVQMRTCITEDHLYTCEVLFPRLQAQGYRGSLSTIKADVQMVRPAKVGQSPLQRYETKPGEHMHYDWGEFHSEKEGKAHKLYGDKAILG